MMENVYFSRLLPELAEKSVQAAIRRLHIQNKPVECREKLTHL